MKTSFRLRMTKLWKHVWNKRILYVFLLPAFLWYTIFSYIPMGGLILIFKDYSFSGGIWGSPFAEPWYKSVRMFFDNPLLWEMIRNTITVSLLRISTFGL
ncbi:MAG: hypothetical protein RBR34_12570, partial [Rhodospirillaceae bacterium]|nr:hypothetical protein [Rhodospirillaceae bacterium]